MSDVLRADLDPDQLLLLRETFAPFDQTGRWPCWAYLDELLDAKGLVAADLLASLPVAGGAGGGQMRYGLTRNDNNHWLPNDKTPLELTAAGMWHLESAAPLLAAFNDAIRYFVERRRYVTPSPYEVPEVLVTSEDVAAWLASPGHGELHGPG